MPKKGEFFTWKSWNIIRKSQNQFWSCFSNCFWQYFEVRRQRSKLHGPIENNYSTHQKEFWKQHIHWKWILLAYITILQALLGKEASWAPWWLVFLTDSILRDYPSHLLRWEMDNQWSDVTYAFFPSQERREIKWDKENKWVIGRFFFSFQLTHLYGM